MTFKKNIFFFIILFCLPAFIFFSQTDDKYKKFADSLLNKGETKQLISFFEKENKLRPKNENILRWLGYVNIEMKNLDGGEKYYLEALKVNPNCARCYGNMARINIERNKPALALEFINKSIGLEPGEAPSYTARGIIKELLGNKLEALMDYDKAVEMDPANDELLARRGEFNINDGALSLALSDFNKAAKISPSNFFYYYKKSDIYFRKKNFNESLKEINKALGLDSSVWYLFYSRANIYSELNEHVKAIVNFDKAIQLKSEEAEIYFRRGLSKYSLEDMDGVCEDMRSAKTIYKKKDSANYNMKLITAYLADICDSSKVSYYYQRGIAFYNKNEFEKSVDWHSRGIKKFPGNSLALSFRGNSYYELKDYNNAMKDHYASIENRASLEKTIRESPRYTGAGQDSLNLYLNGVLSTSFLTISECQVALKQFNEALISINKGIELASPQQPAFESFFVMRGIINISLNKPDPAIKDLDKCIQLNPKVFEAYVQRAFAKIIAEENPPITFISVSGGLASETFISYWTIPLSSKSKKINPAYISALEDCDLAITLNPNFDYAYYVRGHLKKLMGDVAYCADFLKARELGYPVNPEILKVCGK